MAENTNNMAFLQSVLRYTTSHTQANTGEQAPEAIENGSVGSREMSPERKKWLETALSSMTINPIDEMKKCIKYLEENVTNGEKESEPNDRYVEALETIKDWCEDLNFAIDFHKLNGYDLLPKLLNSKYDVIRALTCELIGTCAQNNPYCQETLIKSKIMPLVLYKLDKDVDDVRIKAMFAISCLARDCEMGQQKLLEGNAFEILIKAIQSPIQKLQIKSCFLFSSICSNKAIKEQLTRKNLISILIHMYRDPESSIHEHLLSAINVLIDENPQALRQAKEIKDINFKLILEQRLQLINDDPRFNEEKEMASKIYQDLFQN